MFKIVYAQTSTKLKGNVQIAKKSTARRSSQTPANRTSLAGNVQVARPLRVK